MTVRIGYVGLDHHHRAPYLDSVAQLDDCEVVAVADPYGTTAADVGAASLAGLPHYESTSALVASEAVDVAWLTLANRETPAAIEAALDAGVDVYAEKPGARTAADLEGVAARTRADDATVCFGYAWRAHPVAEELRRRARDGFFGDVRGFDLRFVASKLSTRPTDHYLFDADASRGGVLQWLGVHWLDLLPWLLGDEVARVDATTRLPDHAGVDVEDGATLQFELAGSGAVGTLSAGYHLREGRYDTGIRVYGDEGRCRWDPVGDVFGFDGETTLRLDADDWTGTPVRELTYEYDPAPGYGGAWGLAFFEQFLRAREGEAEVPADADDAVRVLRVLDAAYESADAGGWVSVAPSGCGR